MAGTSTDRLPFTKEDRDLGKAMLTANKWIVRRTETVNLRDDTQVARRVAVDYYVPPCADRTGKPAHLPLMLVRRVAPMSNIDFIDEEGRAIPLLSLRENGAISAVALHEAFQFVLPELPVTLTRRACWDIANARPADAVEALKRLTHLIQDHRRGRKPKAEYRTALRLQRLILVARTLTVNSIIWMRNDDEPGTRRVVKFIYDEPVEILASLLKRLGIFLGLRSVKLGFKTPHMRSSQTYHFEMNVPGSLELRDETCDVQIHEAAAIEERRPPAFFKTFRRELHLYYDLVGTRTLVSNRISVKCRAGRRGFLSLTLASAVLIAALLWSVYLLRRHLVATPASVALPPLLLLVPAVVVTMVNRTGEHPFNALLLTGPRYLISISGALAVIAAAVMAFVSDPAHSGALTTIWLCCAAGSTLVTLLITWSWIASLPVPGRWGSVGALTAVELAGICVYDAIGGSWSLTSMTVAGGLAVFIAVCVWQARNPADNSPYAAYFPSDLRAAGILPTLGGA